MRFEEIRRVITAIVRLHTPTGFLVGAPSATCLQSLISATKPSVNRLDMRDLYSDGRRFYVQPTADGFKLTSNTVSRRNSVGQRLRTQSAATLIGIFDTQANTDTPITMVRLRFHADMAYLLKGLFVPAFISSILIYLPWHPLAISFLVAILFGLAWVIQRIDAALQVGEMVSFVEKVFAILPPVHVPQLQENLPDVVLNAQPSEFMKVWERFYEDRLREEEQ